MKLAIMLTTGTESENTFTVANLAEAAVSEGHEVGIFLMDDGVYSLRPLMSLLDKGMSITLCAHNALERGVGKVEGVLFGSQYDWSQMVDEADRVLAFGQ